MKAYVEINDGFPVNTDIMCAIEGLQMLGYDIGTFTFADIVSKKHRNLYDKFLFVGSIKSMKSIFQTLERTPEPIDFPETNIKAGLIGRKVKLEDLQTVLDRFEKDGAPIFVKPVSSKLFDGVVLSQKSQFRYFADANNCKVLTSEPMKIVSEWRGYVHNGKLVDCRNYSGDFKCSPDYDFIDKNIKAYSNAPIAYTIDMAIVEGEMHSIVPQRESVPVVIEFGDFWAVGSYGLAPDQYATMLIERYFQIIKNDTR